ncbi:MAG: tRNA (adenosine(37)-N6)-dimethylallyltransferase MiaA [Bacteroidetes bacterium]|nr:MAG: tRNA (adenosine(37)-N6)-dimethylallyltransferase MiaA [Bacteroidota bacterium]
MNLLVVLGPTASGKTHLAVRLACELNGEIISADSRQVYRGMDIGTGKDLQEYEIDGHKIPYHLINSVDPGYEYNVYEFQQDFLKAYESITERGRIPILCGGTGLYIESVLTGYRLPKLEPNPELESMLESKSTAELTDLLNTLRDPHNTTDILDRKRLIKAIRIGLEESRKTEHHREFPKIQTTVFGIAPPREELRRRITERLHKRLEHGMVEEVNRLLASGISPETLTFYGLEYKFITLFLQGKLTCDEMVAQLNTGIHQFAKRQITWFRRMEKKGITIHWVNPGLTPEDQLNEILANVPPI